MHKALAAALGHAAKVSFDGVKIRPGVEARVCIRAFEFCFIFALNPKA